MVRRRFGCDGSDHDRCVALDDACLLRRDRVKRVPEVLLMVDADGRDGADHGR